MKIGRKKINAYAKINLNLKVKGARSDGYHDIESLMVPLTLADNIEISLAEHSRIKVTSTDTSLPKGKNNLAYKAARAFFDAVLIRGTGVDIHIDKRIPVAAGLGGGSADAAAVIKGLNSMFNTRMKTNHLIDVAASVGSDVPFCVVNKPCIVSGRGEVLTPAEPLPRLWVVIIHPLIKVSTEWAYKRYDLTMNKTEWYNSVSREFGVRFENDLERATALEHPRILGLKELLLMLGAKVSLMSGSGPSVFGIFDSHQDARRACKALGALAAEELILTRIR